MNLKNRDIIIFSSVDWSTHWQIHHKLCASLLSLNCRVLFVENTGTRTIGLSDIYRIYERLVNRVKSTNGFNEIEGKLFLFSPIFFPFPYSRLLNWFNKILLFKQLTSWIRIVKFKNPIVFAFLPTPLTLDLIDMLNPDLTVFYSVDDMSALSKKTQKLRHYENKLFREADLVFATSKNLMDRALKYRSNAYLLPCGVDFDQFYMAVEGSKTLLDLDNIKRPIIGYVGGMGDVFDQNLICELADNFRDATILLIGPVYSNIQRMKEKHNIVLLGQRPYSDIPYYIKEFDLAVIPYKIMKYTESVYSCKLNEYLALGKAVITTNLQEFNTFNERHGNIIRVAKNNQDFIKYIREELNEDSNAFKKKRILVSKLNSWKSRFDEMLFVIDNYNDQRTKNISKNWRKLLSKDSKSTRNIGKITAYFLLSYLLFFHTPLMWYISKPLIVDCEPRTADSIVVFGGYGELGWKNFGFQKRIVKALNLFNNQYAHDIILSSGVTHTLKETDVMSAILKQNGVPSKSIIIDDGASSTYENVQQTKGLLMKKNHNSILLVTAPIHTQRARLTWKQIAPNIDVCTIVDQNEVNELKWNQNTNNIVIILYEYLAIVHNWFFGRV